MVGGFFAFIVYLILAYFFLYPQAVWSPDEGAKLLQLKSLRWENGHLVYDILYPGRSLDPQLQFSQAFTSDDLLSLRNGRLYFQRLPIFPLIELPFFRLLGNYGLYILPALAGALVGVISMYLIEPEERRVLMWLLIAFGCPILIYSTLFWEHTLASLLALLAAWLVFSFPQIRVYAPSRQIWRWVLAGLVFACSVYLRQEILLFALAFLGAYWLFSKSGRGGIFWTALFFGLALIPYPFLHKLLFSGQAVPDNARYLFYPLAYAQTAGLRVLPDLLIGPPADEAIAPGWLGAVWAVSALTAIVLSFFSERSRYIYIIQVVCLGVNALVAMAYLSSSVQYRSAHGLLFTTPWAVVGLCRTREVWRAGSPHARVLVATLLIGLFGYIIAILGLRASSPHGGLEWGARFAITFYPLLAIFTAWDFRLKRNDIEMGIIFALLFLGFAFQLRGLWTIHTDKRINFALNNNLEIQPVAATVTDLWWVPLNAASLEPLKSIFIIPTEDRMQVWLSLVVSKQITRFALVTLNPELPHQLNDLLIGRVLAIDSEVQVGNLKIYQLRVEEQ